MPRRSSTATWGRGVRRGGSQHNTTPQQHNVHYITPQKEFRQVHSYVGEGCEAGWLTPLVHRHYPLEEAAVCHQDIVNSAGAQGKLVLTTLA
ncbi:hypothetical protein ACOMHN_066114 [Nucella lapillus]